MDNLENDLEKRALKKAAWTEKWRWGVVALVVILVCIMVFFLMFRFKGFSVFWAKVMSALAPIIFGLAIAYILNPIERFWEKLFLKAFRNIKRDSTRNHLARGLSTGLTIIIFVMVIVGLLLAVIPALIQSIITLVNTMPGQVQAFIDWFETFELPDNQFVDVVENTLTSVTENLNTWLKTNLLPQAQTYLTSLTTGVISIAKGILNFIIGIIVAIYVLTIKDTLKGQSKKIIYAIFKPKQANIVLTTVRKSSDIFGGFISGKLVDSAIIGVICYFGCLIIHVPQPLLIAVIIGVTNIIPVFGPFIGAIPALLLVVIQSPIHALYLLIFIVVLQQVDGNIIGPKILGNSTGLSTFWVMFAILIGSGMFGFMGMLLGVPIFGVIYYIIKQIVAYGVRKRHLSDNTLDYIDADYVDPMTLEIVPIDPLAKEKERLKAQEEAKGKLAKIVEEKLAEIKTNGSETQENQESEDESDQDKSE
ncbi:MAG: AI-2E family transporter [Lachnospiraceae bacterium]|nr:AI-2E family transporter [Lachnospiraceae bacterium]